MHNIFDIVRVRFPFSSSSEVKERPALIISDPKLSEKNGLVLCCVITAKPSSKFPLDIELTDYYEMGLPLKCYIRPEKIFSVDKSTIVKKEGELLYNYHPIITERLSQLMPFFSRKKEEGEPSKPAPHLKLVN